YLGKHLRHRQKGFILDTLGDADDNFVSSKKWFYFFSDLAHHVRGGGKDNHRRIIEAFFAVGVTAYRIREGDIRNVGGISMVFVNAVGYLGFASPQPDLMPRPRQDNR